MQTIDLAPTLPEFFGVDRTPDMQGRPLSEAFDDTLGEVPLRESALYGMFGGHVNITDGRWTYLRSCHDATNQPLYEHTLMPVHGRGRFAPHELVDAELADPFDFTKGLRTLRAPARTAPGFDPYRFGSLLYDLADDPRQERPVVDDEVELRMIRLLVRRLRDTDAPPDQYERLGLPRAPEEVTSAHLQVAAHRARPEQEAALGPAPRADEYPEGRLGLRTPLAVLLSDPVAVEAVRRFVPGLTDAELLTVRNSVSLLQLSAVTGQPDRGQLLALEAELARLFPRRE
ncbi:hypothetical protein OKJ48_43795 [Streptomyces kunmingensis]|uniref:Sulfatase n=1 Tax=Streptomyces kunmingensis TaxID=68225 RepID=A0ABU6CSV3_9ACTN|nr:hypothetical protein [Streptomyces kunmingensis]MEB3967112.1 hypothetical protein [Streptomyces kunmingensis]